MAYRDTTGAKAVRGRPPLSLRGFAESDAGVFVAAARCLLVRHPHDTYFLEVFLSRQHVELLHLLRYRKIRFVGAERAVAPLHFSFRHRGRDFPGRAHRRPYWTKSGSSWVSILGVAPFALALPYANLFWTAFLAGVIGLILSSAFSAILVYAQELVPGKVGLMAGLFSDWPLAWAASGLPFLVC